MFNEREVHTTPAEIKQLTEIVDLLHLWYGRWQGVVPGTPQDMVLRTRVILEKFGKPINSVVVQRGT